MSFQRRLFGGGDKPARGPSFEAIDHEGFTVRPEPVPEGGQYRLCAVITRQIGEETREHRMIRADLYPDADSAAEASIRKAKQMIGEQGDRIFG